VVPMSPNNKAAMTLIKNLKGVMMVLNEEAISADDVPSIKTLNSF